MKNKFSTSRLSYFFRQRIHGKDASDHMPESVRIESEWEKTESVIRDILRWANDGGKMSDLGNRTTRSSSPDAARAREKE